MVKRVMPPSDQPQRTIEVGIIIVEVLMLSIKLLQMDAL
jgi:hypothetical protein